MGYYVKRRDRDGACLSGYGGFVSTIHRDIQTSPKFLTRDVSIAAAPGAVGRNPVTLPVEEAAMRAAPKLPGGVEVVLFDVGHTLVNSDRRHAREVVHEVAHAVHLQVKALGFSPPPMHKYLRTAKWRLLAAAVWSRVVRREVQVIEIIRHAHARMGIDLDAEQTRDLAVHAAIAIWDLFEVDPEVPGVMAELSGRGYRLGLISNTWLPGVLFDGYLKHEGLLDHFPLRLYSSETIYMKPDRRIFEHALRELKVAAPQCIFVGDRLDNDVRGPARLGMRTIHFAPTPRRFWQRGNPDFTVRRLSEIPAVLSSLA